MRHLLTAPYSPTTTGKVECLHKTMRAKFFSVARAATMEELQAALDRWVLHYNSERPQQGIGDVPRARRFALAQGGPPEPVVKEDPAKGLAPPKPASMARPATRTVNRDGGIHLARHRYPVGRWLAGDTVEVVCCDALVEVFHRGVLIVSHVARHQPGPRSSTRSPSTRSHSAASPPRRHHGVRDPPG